MMLAVGPRRRELVQQRARPRRQRAGDEIGPARAACGAAPAARATARSRVVARAQHLGHVPAPKSAGRVYCGYSSSGSFAERLLGRRRLVAHHARHQPRDRLDHDERGGLAAGEHEVADRQLAVAAGGRRRAGRRPRTDRSSSEKPSRRRELARDAWSKRRPARRQQEQRSRRLRCLDRGEQRLRHHHHARATTERRVVDAAMASSVVTRADRAAARRAARRRGAADERRRASGPSRYSGKIVKTSMRISRSSRPSGRSTTTTPRLRVDDEHHRDRALPPSSTSRSCAGFASTASTRPSRAPCAVAHLGADQLVHPAARRPAASARIGRPARSARSASAASRSSTPSKRTSQPLLVRGADATTSASSPTSERRPGREALGDGCVTATTTHLAAQPVRPADAADLEADGSSGMPGVGATPRRRP